MINTSQLDVEDIRVQWTTYEKTNQWLSDSKEVLIDYGFAEERNTVREDGLVEELFIPDDLKARIVTFDETDVSLSNDGDKGGPRSKAYTNPDFPRPGGSGCRGVRGITRLY